MKREYGLTLLAGAVGAALILLAVRQHCARAVFTPPKPLTQQVIDVSGADLVPVAGALALAAAMVFVAFGLMIVRRDVASQAIGFFSLENAISLAALVLAAGLPLILETAFLFDLLVAVVVFGMLMRAHHAKAESLSTADLTRLRG